MCTSEKSGVHFYLTVGKCELGGHGTPCPYKIEKADNKKIEKNMAPLKGVIPHRMGKCHEVTKGTAQ